jgi:integrase
LTDKGHIKHPLTKITDNEKRASVTPRMEWIEMVKRYGPITANINARFELMIDWGRTAGLRAFEACYLTISQLPSRETAEKAIINGTNVYILLIVTKGSKDKNIPISPLLIKKTWDYIDTTRKQVIATFKKRAKNKQTIYYENNYIFLSDKTGKAMSPVSFSNSIRKAFLAAVDAGELTEDERVWCHGLRHYFTVTLLKFLDNKKVPRPEAVTRQVTRQGSDDALEPYLTDRFNEEFH